MNRLWESALAAKAFEVATASPIITRHIKRIDRLAGLSAMEVEEWQMRRLQSWLRAARLTIPYYKNSRYKNVDLSALPLLSKDDVRNNYSSLRNRFVPARALATGGTGGQPLLVDISYSSFFHEWGHIAYAWRSAGVSLTDPKITFKGGSLGRGFGDETVAYQKTYNQVLVSPFHLNEGTYRRLLNKLNDLRPRALWGYPSAVSAFAQWVQRNGPFRELGGIRTVLLGSEPAFDWQLKLLEEIFGARVLRWYGLTEKSVFAVECERRDGYHAVPTYGVTEVVHGRVVGTGFTNRAMPLVRYDTEDMGELDTTSCRCGLPFPRLRNIATRRDQTFLFGHGDEPISTTALNFHDPIFAAFSNFQFRQVEPGRITLLLVPAVDGDDFHRLAINARDAIQHRIGQNCSIDVQVVPRNELLSERGKLVVVDQRYQPARS
jgi:phenylacetate-CoA ligase